MMQRLRTNRIYRVDCLEGMQHLSDQSVDMILTDLPYGVTKNNWDKIIDLDRLWSEYRRIIRHKRAIALTARCPFDKRLGMSNPKWLRYEWIWEKSIANGYLRAKHAPLNAHESILIFADGSPRYHPQLTAVRPYINRKGPQFLRNLNTHVRGVVTVNSGFRYPRSVLHIASETRSIHPTQKPLTLFEYLIRTYTKRGELVLDSCMGSGTTAIACLNTGRRFIGFELDPEYHRTAEARIRQRYRALKGAMNFTEEKTRCEQKL
ncbi:MAG TPA: site-specific DNA-methyltransferase [Bryobacteraceae bacterium]|jgi:site-specific DNA-methyltransferase (adenine-specific)|nr:site-specific DNA-methyltransferase [Bryobacteraceae bacterium]